MDDKIRPRVWYHRQLLFGLIAKTLLFGSVAVSQTNLSDDLGPLQSYPIGLAPNAYYRIDSRTNPSKGRLLTIDEFRETGFNFELCEPEGERMTINFLTSNLISVQEDCSGVPTTPFQAPFASSITGAIIVDAQYRPIGVVTGGQVAASQPASPSFAIELDYSAIRLYYEDADRITSLPQDWSISPMGGTVLTAIGETGEIQFILPVTSATAISDTLMMQ